VLQIENAVPPRRKSTSGPQIAYLMMKKKLFPCLMLVFDDGHQNKGRAMSGKAARIFF